MAGTEAGVIQHLKFIILIRGHAPDSQRAVPPSALASQLLTKVLTGWALLCYARTVFIARCCAIRGLSVGRAGLCRANRGLSLGYPWYAAGLSVG